MPVPAVLTVSFSDSSGIAGVGADLRTFAALKTHGLAAVTTVTARTADAVVDAMAVPPALVAAQIATARETAQPMAVKTGVLGSAETIVAVADALSGYKRPLVVDPMLVGRGGAVLMDADAETALKERLLPRASVVTVNIDEAARLTGTARAATMGALMEQGVALLELGPEMVLMTTGRGSGEQTQDILIERAFEPIAMKAPRLPEGATGGAGCTLSAAIAGHAAHRIEVKEALQYAVLFTHGAIAASADDPYPEQGRSPVNQMGRLWEERATPDDAPAG